MPSTKPGTQRTRQASKQSKRARHLLKTKGRTLLDEIRAVAQRCPRVQPALKTYNRAVDEHGSDSMVAKEALRALLDLVAVEMKRTDPRAANIPLSSLCDPREHESGRQELHGGIMVGGLYGRMTRQLVEQTWGEDSGVAIETNATAVQRGDDVLKAMKASDPLEEMLVAQALWTHARVARLNNLAITQTDRENLRIVNEAADRATNTFRRVMLALAEYRRPPRAGDSFTAIKQANIANQQVIQNHEIKESENATNEQGCSIGNPSPAALSTDRSGTTVSSPARSTSQTMDKVHRTANGRRQNPLPDERMEAR